MKITILLKNKHFVLKNNYLCYVMCFDYFCMLYKYIQYLGNKDILTK